MATTEFQRECNDLGLVTTGTDLKPAIAAAFDEYRERLEKARAETLNHAEEKEREILCAEDLITREKSELNLMPKEIMTRPCPTAIPKSGI